MLWILEWLFIQFLSLHLDTFDLVLHISERDRNPRNIYNKTWRNGGKKETIHDLVWQKLVPTYRRDINKFPKICLRKYFRLIGETYL